jgi:glycine reductase
MKLEMASFPVKEARFGKQNKYVNGVLEINKRELVSLIIKDKRILSADVELAFPGEKTRIVNIRDVIEPRVKVSGPGCFMPGILGPVETVGEGKTHRLSGVAVTVSAELTPTIMSGTTSQDASIMDMWGQGALVAPFGSIINIVLVLKLSDAVTELDTHDAIIQAESRVAQHLAETTINASPENIETFELAECDASLPRVIYISSFLTNWHAPHSGIAYYGLPIRESLPTFMHPNEFIDGAMTADARKGSSGYTHTWGWLNHPVVLRLLREHGKRLNFLGVIIQRTRYEAEHGKKVTAACTAQMARLLGADGVIITRTVASGANFVDVMLTLQACEKKGIKTVLLTPEWGGKDGTELPLVLYVPEATAMVSTGSTDHAFNLPVPDKVIGVDKSELIQLFLGEPKNSPWSELTVDDYSITGASDWWGDRKYTRIGY